MSSLGPAMALQWGIHFTRQHTPNRGVPSSTQGTAAGKRSIHSSVYPYHTRKTRREQRALTLQPSGVPVGGVHCSIRQHSIIRLLPPLYSVRPRRVGIARVGGKPMYSHSIRGYVARYNPCQHLAAPQRKIISPTSLDAALCSPTTLLDLNPLSARWDGASGWKRTVYQWHTR